MCGRHSWPYVTSNRKCMSGGSIQLRIADIRRSMGREVIPPKLGFSRRCITTGYRQSKHGSSCVEEFAACGKT